MKLGGLKRSVMVGAIALYGISEEKSAPQNLLFKQTTTFMDTERFHSYVRTKPFQTTLGQ